MGEYHTALKHGKTTRYPPMQRFEVDGSIAFVHDVMTGILPDEYKGCDVFYLEPPWRAGFDEFNRRAGKAYQFTYQDFLDALSRIISKITVPVFMTAGKHWKLKVQPLQGRSIMLNGFEAVLLSFNVKQGCPGDTAEDCIEGLTTHFSRVGDFVCGYGRTGRIFMQNGRSFVMSDHNAECIGNIAAHAPSWKP